VTTPETAEVLRTVDMLVAVVVTVFVMVVNAKRDTCVVVVVAVLVVVVNGIATQVACVVVVNVTVVWGQKRLLR
jgi:hypothetical protein